MLSRKNRSVVSSDLHRGVARHESTLDANRIGGQGQSGRGNAGGPVVSRLVGNQSIGRIDLLQEIFERLPLEPVQQCVIIVLRFRHAYGATRLGLPSRLAAVNRQIITPVPDDTRCRTQCVAYPVIDQPCSGSPANTNPAVCASSDLEL